MSRFRLGTRGSPLALVQARAVAGAIQTATGAVCEIVIIKTSGDRIADARLSDIGGKRLFVKEIEDALLSRDVDLAVHSSKDMSAVLPDGLAIAATLAREDPRDAVVLPGGASNAAMDAVLEHLGAEPRIGTSSVRRIAQLAALMPGASFLPIRGNLDTRLGKLDAGEFDAIVLAAAGLNRLQRGARISASIPVHLCVPAPGQGIIAVETREDDEELRRAVGTIDDSTSSAALEAERALVRELGGGCQMPIGAHAVIENRRMTLTALVASLDGRKVVRSETSGSSDAAEEIGRRAAGDLLSNGAADILADVTHAHAAGGHA